MKSLIIGGAGFVGSYLIRHLQDELHHDIYATKMPNETLQIENVTILDLNILEKDSILSLIEQVRPDYIFHLAAQSSVALSWKNPALTVDVNVKGAVNLFEALKEAKDREITPKVLIIGSGEEYGHIRPEETPVEEENNVRPGNIYAATKVCQNLLGKIYADAYALHLIMVRAFNHIGPNQLPVFVVADFCKQVAEIEAGKKEPVLHVGNLAAKRDFTDVRDVVRAYSLLIEEGEPGETYNVGSGKALAVDEILQMILAVSSTKIQVIVDEAKLRPVDIPIIEADIHKIKDRCGWSPKIPIEQTINETLTYWRNIVRL